MAQTIDDLNITDALGIRTTTPRRPLDVSGEIVAVDRLTLAQDTGVATTTWHADNWGGLFRLFWQPNINTVGTVALMVTTDGQVQVVSEADPTILRIQSHVGFGAARLEFWSDPQGSVTEWRPGGIHSVDAGGFTGGLAFFTNGSGQANRTAEIEAMRITNRNVGIGMTNPSQRLTLGSGNVLLPSANYGQDGNLYFGGTTDTGQIGMRLFGGNVNNGQFRSGFIDVRAGTPTDGLIFRVDTSYGSAERMRICANGNILVTGDIVLQNADCAEEFAVNDCGAIEPGTLMVLTEDGSLRPSTEAYDKKVAGVISGAGDLKPGLVLDKQPESRNRMPLALMGKVNCKADAQYGAIEAGDLLTTSPTSGHAMKATDPAKAFGTVIGKALKPLKTGTGLIPLLISLQ